MSFLILAKHLHVPIDSVCGDVCGMEPKIFSGSNEKTLRLSGSVGKLDVVIVTKKKSEMNERDLKAFCR